MNLGRRKPFSNKVYLYIFVGFALVYMYQLKQSKQKHNCVNGFQWSNKNSHKKSFSLNKSPRKTPFTILFWTGEFGLDAAKLYYKPECENEYILTSNRSMYGSADVVIFFYVDVSRGNVELPSPRNPNIPWGLAFHESAINYALFDTKVYNNVFNFTWTFRTDSEICPIFDNMVSKYKSPEGKWEYGSKFANEFLQNKTKFAAWVVSNCHTQPSKRNELVKSLAAHGVQIDIFGACGNQTCQRDGHCFENLGKEYKFFMSMENSLCVDYITEKIYHGLFNNMVPIVYALGKIDNYAPPGSFIDVMQFDSTEKLASYLKFLNNNPEVYLKYFKWRSAYNISNVRNTSNHNCHNWRMMRQYTERLLGDGMHADENAKRSSYTNLETWYYYFYNTNFCKFCRNCLEKDEVDANSPSLNVVKMFRTESRCK